MTRATLLSAVLILVYLFCGALTRPAQAADLVIIQAAKHDVSPALRDLAASAQANTGGQQQALVPQPTGPELTSSQPDPVVQQLAAPLSGVSTVLNFDGQSANDTRNLLGVAFVPPDTNGAAGMEGSMRSQTEPASV